MALLYVFPIIFDSFGCMECHFSRGILYKKKIYSLKTVDIFTEGKFTVFFTGVPYSGTETPRGGTFLYVNVDITELNKVATLDIQCVKSL